jgi:predicted neutral ceramidase superfamily lipid hydrolase
MTMRVPELLVTTAGWLSLTQLPAMIVAPRVLGWREDFSTMRPVNRQIVTVVMGAIVFVVVGLGLVTAWAGADMISGGRAGTGLCIWSALFWAARSVVQWRVYSKTWPRDSIVGAVSHYSLGVMFTFMSLAYGVGFVAAIRAAG